MGLAHRIYAASFSFMAVEATSYYPFGEQRVNSGSFSEQRKFTGHEYDDDSNLTYAKQRYFDHDAGRFLSQDPAIHVIGLDNQLERKTGRNIRQFLADPQLLNAYSYARNNPVVFDDPNGEVVPLLGPAAIGIIMGTFDLATIGLAVSSALNFKTTAIDYPNQFTSQQKMSVAIEAFGAPATRVISGIFGTTREIAAIAASFTGLDLVQVISGIPDAIDHTVQSLTQPNNSEALINTDTAVANKDNLVD